MYDEKENVVLFCVYVECHDCAVLSCIIIMYDVTFFLTEKHIM